MLYVKLDGTGQPCEYPISGDMLRRRFPHTALPAALTEEVLRPINYAQVPETLAPARVPGHATVPDVPELDALGNVVRTFRHIPYTEEGLRKRMDELRSKRGRLLSESDWTQSEDVQAGMTATQKQEWSDYRAALRNLTEDFEDPNIVTWPKMPDSPVLPVVDTMSAEAAIKRKIAAKRMDVQGSGMPYLFSDGVNGTVQTRNEIDVINILGQAVGSIALSMQGDAVTTLPFRDAENVTHLLTPPEMLQMAMAALQFVSATYANKWTLEQQLDALVASGATTEQIMAFDISVGW